MAVAERATDWCMSLLDQQQERSRYYYQMTKEGRLVTPEVSDRALYIDAAKPKQPYWEVGLPQMLMCRMFMVTGHTRYMDYATRFFEKHVELFEDRFTHTGSGKTCLANAVYYLLTRDRRAREAVVAFCERLVQTQTPEGSWIVGGNEALLNRVDAAAEFNVWLQEAAAVLAAEG